MDDETVSCFDIVAILDSAGAKVVEYRYDAWGRDIGRILTSDIRDIGDGSQCHPVIEQALSITGEVVRRK